MASPGAPSTASLLFGKDSSSALYSPIGTHSTKGIGLAGAVSAYLFFEGFRGKRKQPEQFLKDQQEELRGTPFFQN